MVNTQYAFARGSVRGAESGVSFADPRGALLQVTYNLSDASDRTTAMYRVCSTPRIGFFTTSYVSFDSDKKEDLTTKLILRWNIKKADPAARI